MSCPKCGGQIHQIWYPTAWKGPQPNLGKWICQNCGNIWKPKGGKK